MFEKSLYCLGMGSAERPVMWFGSCLQHEVGTKPQEPVGRGAAEVLASGTQPGLVVWGMGFPGK